MFSLFTRTKSNFEIKTHVKREWRRRRAAWFDFSNHLFCVLFIFSIEKKNDTHCIIAYVLALVTRGASPYSHTTARKRRANMKSSHSTRIKRFLGEFLSFGSTYLALVFFYKYPIWLSHNNNTTTTLKTPSKANQDTHKVSKHHSKQSKAKVEKEKEVLSESHRQTFFAKKKHIWKPSYRMF